MFLLSVERASRTHRRSHHSQLELASLVTFSQNRSKTGYGITPIKSSRRCYISDIKLLNPSNPTKFRSPIRSNLLDVACEDNSTFFLVLINKNFQFGLCHF